MDTKKPMWWEVAAKAAAPLEFASFIGLLASLILPDTEAAMEWANSHGFVLLFGVLTLFFAFVWFVTWFKAKNDKLDRATSTFEQKGERVFESFSKREEEIRVEIADAYLKRIIDEGVQSMETIDHRLNNITAAIGSIVPYLHDPEHRLEYDADLVQIIKHRIPENRDEPETS